MSKLYRWEGGRIRFYSEKRDIAPFVGTYYQCDQMAR